jgi:hypothetical protein
LIAAGCELRRETRLIRGTRKIDSAAQAPLIAWIAIDIAAAGGKILHVQAVSEPGAAARQPVRRLRSLQRPAVGDLYLDIDRAWLGRCVGAFCTILIAVPVAPL